MKTKTVSFGLLILRIGIGAAFIIHGAPKLFGGADTWEALGSTMSVFGVNFSPKIFGFLAGLIEFVGGLFFLTGFMLRFTSIALAVVMLVATISLWSNGADFVAYSHPLKMFLLFASMIFIGSGTYSLDEMLFPKQRSVYVVKETTTTK